MSADTLDSSVPSPGYQPEAGSSSAEAAPRSAEAAPSAEAAAPSAEAAPSTTPSTVSAPSIVDGVRRSLDPRAIPLARLIGKITTACVGVGLAAVVAIVWTAARPPTPMLALMAGGWFAVVGVLAWWLHRWAEISHRHASYTVHGEGVEIRRGVWWRAVISIPRSRVQHTDVAQGPLERRYGLGTLAIYTAGREHAKVDLHGLDHQTAFAIRDHLLPQAEVDAV